MWRTPSGTLAASPGPVIDNLKAGVHHGRLVRSRAQSQAARVSPTTTARRSCRPSRPCPVTRARSRPGSNTPRTTRSRAAAFDSLAEQNRLLYRVGTHGGRHAHPRHGTPAGWQTLRVESSGRRCCRCPPRSSPALSRCSAAFTATATSSSRRPITPHRRSTSAGSSGCAPSPGSSACSMRAWNWSALTPAPRPAASSPPTNTSTPTSATRVERGADYLLQRCRLLGPNTGAWAEAMLQNRGPYQLRVLQGLLHLARQHPVRRIERAAGIALHRGAFRLRDLSAGSPRRAKPSCRSISSRSIP